ncbi:MAG TPA: hypothetical protein VH639_28045 [Bryobacteraceae bacterium]|jgi:hypothetical protein
MFANKLSLAGPAVLTLLVSIFPLPAPAQGTSGPISFSMVVSGGAATCLPNAKGLVELRSIGNVEVMTVTVLGLPPNTDFDFFVLQVPKSPFGIAWYQGDIQTDKTGRGHQQFVGRFSIETFAVAVGSAPAPVTFNGPFPDASINPPFSPIQMYHLGLWFNSPTDASAAGCASTVTPFNGEHDAGIQVLNTSNFPDNSGPLLSIQ